MGPWHAQHGPRAQIKGAVPSHVPVRTWGRALVGQCHAQTKMGQQDPLGTSRVDYFRELSQKISVVLWEGD